MISSCGLMIPFLWGGPLSLDEHGSYWVISSDLPGTVLQRSLNYTAVPPLSSWLQQISIACLGKSEFSFRLPSALAAIAAVFVIYFCGKLMSHNSISPQITGGLASLLVAWHPIAVDEVRIARCYGLVLLMAALVLYSTLLWARSDKPILNACLWAICASGLLWTHYTSALLVMISAGCLLLIVWKKDDRPRQLVAWCVAMLLVTVVCLPLITPVLRLKEWGPFLNYSAANVSVWEVIGPFWWLGFPLGFGVKFLCDRVWVQTQQPSTKSYRYDLWLLVACSVGPLLILAVLSQGSMSSLANPRYQIAYIPGAVCLFAALLSGSGRWQSGLCAVLVLLSGVWCVSPRLPWEPGRIGNTTAYEWQELNAVIAKKANPSEPVFVQSGLMESNLVPVFAEDRQFMEYAACRVGKFYVDSSRPRYALPFHWDTQFNSEKISTEQFYRELLQSWSDPNVTFWIASATDTDLNQQSLDGIVRIAKQAGFEEFDSQRWQTATLLRYRKSNKTSADLH